MKILSIAIAVVVIATAFGFISHSNFTDNKADTGFAVVELFTSEGCSSCPPADAALAKLKTEYGSNVFVMAFHVDYWNRLGWKDEYSSSAYSKRQGQYSQLFHLNGVYTPQAVVNGMVQFTGSNTVQLHNSINAQLSNTENKNWSLKAERSGNKVLVSCDATTDKNSVLCIALIENKTSSNVTAGENSGRKLQHVNVVRDFVTIAGTPGNIQPLNIPKGVPTNNVAVIAFTQNKLTGAITAAKEITAIN